VVDEESPEEPTELERQQAEGQSVAPEGPEPVVVDPTSQVVLGTVTQWMEWHSGPLPSPRELEAYNHVSPGLADVIVSEWRTETAHRRRLEQFTLSSQVRAQGRGQIFGLAIALVIVFCGVGLTLAHDTTVGLAAIIGPLATLTGVFVYGEVRRRR
jgi:uncharacterized membrane protein